MKHFFAALLAMTLLSSAYGDDAAAVAFGNDSGKFKSSIIGKSEADGTSYYLLNREGLSADFLLVAEPKTGALATVWGDSVVTERLQRKLPKAACQSILKQWAAWMVKTDGAQSVRSVVDQSEKALAGGKDNWIYKGDVLAALKAATGG